MVETAQQIVQGFAGAIKGLRLYPPGHPAVERQIRNFREGLFQIFPRKKTVRIGLLEGTLFLEDHLFYQGGPSADEIIALFQGLGLEGLEFQAGLPTEEVETLIGLVKEGCPKGEHFEQELTRLGIRHIRAVTIQTREETGEITPHRVYGRALKVVDDIFHDVRMGKIPATTEVVEVVKDMVELTLSDPQALFALSMLKDYDNYTFTHSVNVSVIALAVGRACGLNDEELRVLGLGGLLHDLGKLKIDPRIINKPGRLTPQEFEQIKTHPRTGADIALQMEGIPIEVIRIILGHHRHYDRKGYPGETDPREITPMTDMVTIADTYDAITTLRSYQRPITPRKATNRLRELSGSILHPDFVERFIDSLGTYPVGSLVRLDSNEIGLVIWVDTSDSDSVRLKILFDAEGRALTDPHRIDLLGPDAKRIVAEVDPVTKGIDVPDYLD
jgi:putative nucleotidyltransferase with HDIG domain